MTHEELQKEIDLIGSIEDCDFSLIAKTIELYIQADEVERALWILNNLPGKHRDYIPYELVKLKAEILAAMVTPHAYLTSELDNGVHSPEGAAEVLGMLMRGVLLKEEVKRFNDKALIPHLIDMGPGEYFIPIGLKHLNYRFTYLDLGMDKRTSEKAHPLLYDVRREKCGDVPKIFIAMEIIEHLPEPRDIVVECLRHFGDYPDRIHMSTPCYTFDGGKKDWRKPCGLPHLRTYTPTEFVKTANDLFPGYRWEVYKSRIMSIRGCRVDKADTPLFEDHESLQLELDKAKKVQTPPSTI